MNIEYKCGFKYQLSKDYTVDTHIYPKNNISSEFIELSTYGVLYIKSGYAWNGPNRPALHTSNFMRGSLVHDALYQLMREGLLSPVWRGMADVELVRICTEDGMSNIRTKWVHWAVSNFGSSCARVGKRRETKIAPKEK